FGIVVGPARRIDRLLLHEISLGGTSFRIGDLTHHAVRLVEQDKHERSGAGNRSCRRLRVDQSCAGVAAPASVPCSKILSPAGFWKFRVMRSDSPMARYLSRSVSPRASEGGRVHTPFS